MAGILRRCDRPSFSAGVPTGEIGAAVSSRRRGWGHARDKLPARSEIDATTRFDRDIHINICAIEIPNAADPDILSFE